MTIDYSYYYSNKSKSIPFEKIDWILPTDDFPKKPKLPIFEPSQPNGTMFYPSDDQNAKLAYYLPVQRPNHIQTEPKLFKSLQKFIGTVLQIQGDQILVQLQDKTHDKPDMEATLSIEEIPQEDRALLKPGAIFYWHIGYRIPLKGGQERVSIIRFKRVPLMTPERIEPAKTEAQKLKVALGW
ncbi:MAG: hypothetical protein H7832_03160 [Magnetococcus sp. DMHC-6]